MQNNTYHARTVSLANPAAAVKTAAVAELADACIHRSTRRALHNFLNLRKAHHARTVSITNPAAAVKTAAVAELADATNASTHLRIAPKAAA